MTNPKGEELQKFFNMQNKAVVKKMFKLILPKIYLNQVIYVPKLMKEMTIEELDIYKIQCYKQSLSLKDQELKVDKRFQIGLKKYDSSKYVKVRVLCNSELDVNFETRYVKDPQQL